MPILKGSLNWNGKFTVLETENGTQEFFFLLWKYLIYICIERIILIKAYQKGTYCETHKTVNTKNIYGMLLCCEK